MSSSPAPPPPPPAQAFFALLAVLAYMVLLRVPATHLGVAVSRLWHRGSDTDIAAVSRNARLLDSPRARHLADGGQVQDSFIMS